MPLIGRAEIRAIKEEKAVAKSFILGARCCWPWNHALVPKSTLSKRVFMAGIVLLGVAVVMNALHFAGLVVVVPGLVVCVSAAALTASTPGQSQGDSILLNQMPTPGRSAMMTALLLGAVTLLPFVAVGALIVAGADPLAVFLIGLGLFALAAVLVVTYLVVFFANGWMTGRRDESQSLDRPS